MKKMPFKKFNYKKPTFAQPKPEPTIFDDIGYRSRNHILEHLTRMADPDYKVAHPSWEEVDLYDFVKSSVNKETFTVPVKKNNINLREPSQEILPKIREISKTKTLNVADLVNPAVQEIARFYLNNKDAAAANDYFLNIDNDRAYGFVLLNVHSADIDAKMGPKAKENHLLIRYNENVANTTDGWKLRLDYITQIFSKQGFNVARKGGYLFMEYANPTEGEGMRGVMREAIRGLASTTHLNITFEDFPDTLDKAVAAYNSGITNVHTYIEHLPEVAKAKALLRVAQQWPTD